MPKPNQTSRLHQFLTTAADKLTTLDNTQAIGLELDARGIEGVPGCTQRCALAEWFIVELHPYGTNLWIDINVHDGTWTVTATEYDRTDETATVDLAAHVGHFASQFDHGVWPQLELNR